MQNFLLADDLRGEVPKLLHWGLEVAAAPRRLAETQAPQGLRLR